MNQPNSNCFCRPASVHLLWELCTHPSLRTATSMVGSPRPWPTAPVVTSAGMNTRPDVKVSGGSLQGQECSPFPLRFEPGNMLPEESLEANCNRKRRACKEQSTREKEKTPKAKKWTLVPSLSPDQACFAKPTPQLFSYVSQRIPSLLLKPVWIRFSATWDTEGVWGIVLILRLYTKQCLSEQKTGSRALFPHGQQHRLHSHVVRSSAPALGLDGPGDPKTHLSTSSDWTTQHRNQHSSPSSPTLVYL